MSLTRKTRRVLSRLDRLWRVIWRPQMSRVTERVNLSRLNGLNGERRACCLPPCPQRARRRQHRRRRRSRRRAKENARNRHVRLPAATKLAKSARANQFLPRRSSRARQERLHPSPSCLKHNCSLRCRNYLHTRRRTACMWWDLRCPW